MSSQPPSITGPDFDSAAVYWGTFLDQGADCALGRITAQGRRQPRLITGQGACEGIADAFAADRGQLFYTGFRGVFRADTAAWRACSRLPDGCASPLFVALR